MGRAASRHGVEPRSLSFKGVAPTLQACQPVIVMLEGASPEDLSTSLPLVPRCDCTHRVVDRVDLSVASASGGSNIMAFFENHDVKPNLRRCVVLARTKCHSSVVTASVMEEAEQLKLGPSDSAIFDGPRDPKVVVA